MRLSKAKYQSNLVQLCKEVLQRKVDSIESLASLLNVDKRTVYNYVSILEKLGLIFVKNREVYLSDDLKLLMEFYINKKQKELDDLKELVK